MNLALRDKKLRVVEGNNRVQIWGVEGTKEHKR